jgi:multimeric flavodoxin WrbA
MENVKVLAFAGSPRNTGNSRLMLERFVKGAEKNRITTEVVDPHQLRIKPCTGCLRCNILKRCSLREDDWSGLSEKILASDLIVFATPVYFHHLPAPLKLIIDRFRSFIHVQITETGLIHTPHEQWNKQFVLLLSMGSSDDRDAEPVVELFRFMTSILGSGNGLHQLKATRLAMAGQVIKTADQLKILYERMKLPLHLAEQDEKQNRELLDKCENLGYTLTRK